MARDIVSEWDTKRQKYLIIFCSNGTERNNIHVRNPFCVVHWAIGYTWQETTHRTATNRQKYLSYKVKVKVKQSRYRPRVAQSVPGS